MITDDKIVTKRTFTTYTNAFDTEKWVRLPEVQQYREDVRRVCEQYEREIAMSQGMASSPGIDRLTKWLEEASLEISNLHDQLRVANETIEQQSKFEVELGERLDTAARLATESSEAQLRTIERLQAEVDALKAAKKRRAKR